MESQTGIVLLHLLSMGVKSTNPAEKDLGLHSTGQKSGDQFELTGQVIGSSGRGVWISVAVLHC